MTLLFFLLKNVDKLLAGLVEEEVLFNSLVAFSYTSLLVHLVQGYYLYLY